MFHVHRHALLVLVLLSATSARLRDIVPSLAVRFAHRNLPSSLEQRQQQIYHRAATFQTRGGGGNVKTQTSTKSNPWISFVGIIRDSRRDLLAAAAARCTSIFTMYPVDTLKVRAQDSRLFLVISIGCFLSLFLPHRLDFRWSKQTHFDSRAFTKGSLALSLDKFHTGKFLVPSIFRKRIVPSYVSNTF